MMAYPAGMMVRQKAIEWWPYLAHMIDRLNAACETKNPEALTDIFLDAGKMAGSVREEVTVAALQAALKTTLKCYRRAAGEVRAKRRRLDHGGKPLKASTRKQYDAAVKGWPKRRDALKQEIRQKLDEIRAFSSSPGKIISRGKVSMKLIYGGQHPARLKFYHDENQWRQVR